MTNNKLIIKNKSGHNLHKTNEYLTNCIRYIKTNEYLTNGMSSQQQQIGQDNWTSHLKSEEKGAKPQSFQHITLCQRQLQQNVAANSCPSREMQQTSASCTTGKSQEDNYNIQILIWIRAGDWKMSSVTPRTWHWFWHYHNDHALAALLLFVSSLTSQQHASVSQGRICTDNFMCCHTETEVADQTFYLTQSQYTDTGPTSPSADPITPAPGRVATGVPIFKSLVWLDPEKIPVQAGFEPRIVRSRGGRLNHYANEAVWRHWLLPSNQIFKTELHIIDQRHSTFGIHITPHTEVSA